MSFKDALNSGLRSALGQQTTSKRFHQRTFSLGAEQFFRWDKALPSADAIEDEELTRKLMLRK